MTCRHPLPIVVAMRLTRAFRYVLSLPLLWLGCILGAVQFPIATAFLKAAFRVSEDGDIGLQAITQILQRQGRPLAMDQAQQWLQTCPRPQLAAIAGLMSVDEHDFDAAREYLSQGQKLGNDAKGLLELLEINVVEHSKDESALQALVLRLRGRKDLSPIMSKYLARHLVYQDLTSGRMDEALIGAQRMIGIDEDQWAGAVVWACCLARGKTGRAARALRIAERAPLPERLVLMAVACHCTGQAQLAGEILSQLREHNPEMAATVERLMAGGKE